MSHVFHNLYRSRLCRGRFRDRPRPILVNNWEATYFDFNRDKILTLADQASELGVEMLVLDDGWFGERNNDGSSLGDWTVNLGKLPLGLGELAQSVKAKGLMFGLWFEPEMVSPKSKLYENHPDWCLHIPGRARTVARNQLVLDLTRPEVRDYIVDSVSRLLRTAPIDYVKWDMNRHHTEVGSTHLRPERQKEVPHRYILGLYEILERITSAFPHVLFESCSGGGGRFDPGMLYYMPQTWTSDNTDAASRLRIQYGTSLAYPPVTMGSHVSAVPNHQVQRTTDMRFRGEVAMAGNLGYELDFGKLSRSEKEEATRQIELYKRIRAIVQFGEFYRLRSPFEGNTTAWIFIARDGSEAWTCYYRILAEANAQVESLKLEGLDPDSVYRVSNLDGLVGGDQLLYSGLPVELPDGDFQSMSWLIQRVDPVKSVRESSKRP
jgi:alpha-galactosidase